MNLQLSDVLTVAGAVGTAGLITGLVEVLKKLLPIIGERKLEPAAAIIASAVLVVGAFVDQHTYTLDAAFVAFIAWLAIAKLATGIHDEITAAPTAIFNPPSG